MRHRGWSGRRAAAVVVLVAVTVGIGLWVRGEGGTDDEDDAARGPSTTTAAFASLQDLGDALGCGRVGEAEDVWVPVPGVASGDCRPGGGRATAALHLSDSAEAQADLVAYFESSSMPLPPEASLTGCAGDTPGEARDRGRYHVVVGGRWVVTTYDDEVAEEVVTALDGAPADFSPAPQPPASYLPGGDPCAEA